MESIGDILQKANLSAYTSPLLEVGADDMDQLASLPDQDFQSLIEMIGMAKKPFHVMRFKKAINRANHSNSLLCQTSCDNSTHTVTVYATQIDEPNSIPASNPLLHRASATTATQSNHSLTPPSTTFLELMNTNSTTDPKPAVVLSKLTGHQLQNLVDETMIIQRELGPSPISPEIWDNKRRDILHKAAVLFSNSISPLTDQEHLMNEAAFQLCMWDPTLLVRQKDLFILAKKLLKQYSPAYTDVDHPTYSLADDSNWSNVPLSVNRGPDGKFRSCFEENYERRELQIQQIELLIAENASKEKMKQALLLQAKEKMDYSLALKIQEELSILGKTQREYKSEMSRLRKVQRRSIRHQELKKLKKTTEPNSQTSPEPNFCSPSYSMTTSIPTTSLDTAVTMTTGSTGLLEISSQPVDNVPLQLHTYMHDSVQTVAIATPSPEHTHYPDFHNSLMSSSGTTLNFKSEMQSD